MAYKMPSFLQQAQKDSAAYAKAYKPVLESAFNDIKGQYNNNGALYSSAIYNPMTQAADSFNRQLMDYDRQNRDYYRGIQQDAFERQSRSWELANAAALNMGSQQPKLWDKGKIKMPGLPKSWTQYWKMGDPPENEEPRFDPNGGPIGDGTIDYLSTGGTDSNGMIAPKFTARQTEQDALTAELARAQEARLAAQTNAEIALAQARQALDERKFKWEEMLVERGIDPNTGKPASSDPAWEIGDLIKDIDSNNKLVTRSPVYDTDPASPWFGKRKVDANGVPYYSEEDAAGHLTPEELLSNITAKYPGTSPSILDRIGLLKRIFSGMFTPTVPGVDPNKVVGVPEYDTIRGTQQVYGGRSDR